MQGTRIARMLAVVGALAFLLALVPSHSEAGTIPTPTGTGAVCVVNGKVQPTACAIGGGGGITTVANGGTGAAMSCADGYFVQADSATALRCDNKLSFGPAGSVAATGLMRLPDADQAVISGLNTGSTYEGLRYGGATSSTWTFGNPSEYTQINGYDVRLAPGGGGYLYVGAYAYFTDAITGRVADLNAMNLALASDFTTTLATATTLNTSFSCAAADVFELEWWGTVSNPSGGVKFSIVAPVTSTVEGWLDGVTTTVTTFSRQRFTAINTLNTTATNTGVSIPALNQIKARVNCVAGGTVGIGVASVTAGQTTTVRAGSTLRAQRTVPL